MNNIKKLIILILILVLGFIFYYNPFKKDSAAIQKQIEVLKSIRWSKDITVTISGSNIHLQSNGIPNHKRDAQYVIPKPGHITPHGGNAVISDDPTKPQDYDFTIPLSPKMASHVTKAPLGSIGLMISGAVLYNPFEGDDKTVAMASNFYLVNKDGKKVWFIDSCNGHPTPIEGAYHYHALSNCVASQVDKETGPSHITGIALDGFFIYGSKDINGKQIDRSLLDECNGIYSKTPEFPEGIYHYVLPGTNDETSSIRCFKGVVDIKQIMPMPPMGMPEKQ